MSPDDQPTVRFALGDDIERVLSASSYPIHVVELHGIDLVQVTALVRVEHARSPGGFTLPEVPLVVLAFHAGKLTGARLCPHAGPFDDAGAAAAGERVAAIVEEAGWRRVPGLGVPPDAVLAELSDPARPVDTRVLVGKWMYGDDAVLLEVDRSGSAVVPGEPPSPPISRVRMRIENAPLTKRAIGEVEGSGRNVIWRRGA